MKLICYLSNGYPSIESSIDMAKIYVDAGCDMIEIDFPSRNPYLEGPFIADRMAKALQHCDDYDAYIHGLRKIKKLFPTTPFILLVYENTISEIGVKKFIDFCKKNDYQDIILCGLSSETIKNQLIEQELRVNCYVRFGMYEDEIASAKNSNGFVYLQAVAQNPKEINNKYPTLKDCIRHLKEVGITRPIYCGVGLHRPEDVLMARESGADAVFIGSTILKLQENIPEMTKKIREFKAMC